MAESEEVVCLGSTRSPAEAVDAPANYTVALEDLDYTAQARVAKLDEEIADVTEQLAALKRRQRQLRAERASLFVPHEDVSTQETVDYVKTRFPWSNELLRRAQSVFGIRAFRMGQEGVCNAAMDQRDVMVVMPTGAGKSLCYQLPAVLSDALTLVVSPLVALMSDQVYNLRAKHVPCALLSSTVPKEAAQAILQSVRQNGVDTPRLLYVTPERVAKSKALLAALQQAYEEGRLARIVVDEAHCCSTMGHDYRPDYNKLSICRRLFPETPMMGLTATLGPRALRDVIQILGMRPITDPAAAVPRRTVYFRAPLHRPNLHYRVATRPTSTLGTHEAIRAYIEAQPAGASGIVYCLSRKDTHTIAAALAQRSDGRIRTGVYHSDLDEDEKHRVHTRWRSGEIAVVCATIAFGMGIDKGDVRFVLHACVSKSLDGYYQETGRAGYVASAPELTQSRRTARRVHAAVPPRRPESREWHDGRRGRRPGEMCVCLRL